MFPPHPQHVNIEGDFQMEDGPPAIRTLNAGHVKGVVLSQTDCGEGEKGARRMSAVADRFLLKDA